MAYEDDNMMVRVPIDTWAILKETGRLQHREVGQQLVFLVERGLEAEGIDLSEVDLMRPVAELEERRQRRTRSG